MRPFQTKAPAQAIVEFALASTLIFMLLAAAIDLGLLFFTYQGITNAAQEGATYGSRWLIDKDGAPGVRQLDIVEIQNRARLESGTNGGNGISRLTDLNSDGIDDIGQPDILDRSGTSGYIQVKAVADTNRDGNPSNDNTPCVNPATTVESCFAVVTVRKVYDVFFPLAPDFGNEYTISTTYYLLLRDSYKVAGGEDPRTIPAPPTPSPGQIKAVFVVPTGTTFTSTGATKFEVKAWDEAVSPTGTNGAGIKVVTMKLFAPDGTAFAAQLGDSAPKYCLFGGGCNAMTSTQWNNMKKGLYVLQATATAPDGRSVSIQTTIEKK
ncbi:MAG: pilus assembly protein [Roseiflexaceae bacterium]|nr:pilus assembly protein [Roseiflexaceae bacterium]